MLRKLRAGPPRWRATSALLLFPCSEGGSACLIRSGSRFLAGMLPDEHRNKHAPPHWIFYWHVTSCAESTAKVKELGGRVYVPPVKIENQLYFSVCADPSGAAFALFESLSKPD